MEYAVEWSDLDTGNLDERQICPEAIELLGDSFSSDTVNQAWTSTDEIENKVLRYKVIAIFTALILAINILATRLKSVLSGEFREEEYLKLQKEIEKQAAENDALRNSNTHLSEDNKKLNVQIEALIQKGMALTEGFEYLAEIASRHASAIFAPDRESSSRIKSPGKNEDDDLNELSDLDDIEGTEDELFNYVKAFQEYLFTGSESTTMPESKTGDDSTTSESTDTAKKEPKNKRKRKKKPEGEESGKSKNHSGGEQSQEDKTESEQTDEQKKKESEKEKKSRNYHARRKGDQAEVIENISNHEYVILIPVLGGGEEKHVSDTPFTQKEVIRLIKKVNPGIEVKAVKIIDKNYDIEYVEYVKAVHTCKLEYSYYSPVEDNDETTVETQTADDGTASDTANDEQTESVPEVIAEDTEQTEETQTADNGTASDTANVEQAESVPEVIAEDTEQTEETQTADDGTASGTANDEQAESVPEVIAEDTEQTEETQTADNGTASDTANDEQAESVPEVIAEDTEQTEKTQTADNRTASDTANVEQAESVLEVIEEDTTEQTEEPQKASTDTRQSKKGNDSEESSKNKKRQAKKAQRKSKKKYKLIRGKTNAWKPYRKNSHVTASLLAKLLTTHFVLMASVFRIVNMFWLKGMGISQGTVYNWISIAAKDLLPLATLMMEELKTCGYIHADETTGQVHREDGRDDDKKSYFFFYVTASWALHKVCCVKYHPGRSGAFAEEDLKGWVGKLITDAYQGYNKVVGIIRCMCLSHARRYFFLAAKFGCTSHRRAKAKQIVALFDQLFANERTYKQEGLTFEQILERRQKESKKIFDSISCLSLEIVESDKYKSSQLFRAASYFCNNKEGLSQFLNDGKVPLSNNLAERMVKPFALFRANCLFSGSPKGAANTTTCFTVVRTAELNGLDVQSYLEYVFTQIGDTPEKQRDREFWLSLLPWAEGPQAHCGKIVRGKRSENETFREVA